MDLTSKIVNHSDLNLLVVIVIFSLTLDCQSHLPNLNWITIALDCVRIYRNNPWLGRENLVLFNAFKTDSCSSYLKTFWMASKIVNHSWHKHVAVLPYSATKRFGFLFRDRKYPSSSNLHTTFICKNFLLYFHHWHLLNDNVFVPYIPINCPISSEDFYGQQKEIW